MGNRSKKKSFKSSNCSPFWKCAGRRPPLNHSPWHFCDTGLNGQLTTHVHNETHTDGLQKGDACVDNDNFTEEELLCPRCDVIPWWWFLRNHYFPTKWTNPHDLEFPNLASLLSENSTPHELPHWARCLLRGIPTALQWESWWPPTTPSREWYLRCLQLPTSTGRSTVTIIAAAPLWELPHGSELDQSSMPNRAPIAQPRVLLDAKPVELANATRAICPKHLREIGCMHPTNSEAAQAQWQQILCPKKNHPSQC